MTNFWEINPYTKLFGCQWKWKKCESWNSWLTENNHSNIIAWHWGNYCSSKECDIECSDPDHCTLSLLHVEDEINASSISVHRNTESVIRNYILLFGVPFELSRRIK